VLREAVFVLDFSYKNLYFEMVKFFQAYVLIYRSVIKFSRWIFWSLFLPFCMFGQSTIVVRPTIVQHEFKNMRLQFPLPIDRPKVGVVLSGGGARGLAQIGVLRVLEKYHVPIDVIVGNSFGSVIGGLYAAGYSPAQIESIAIHTNWNELLSFTEETKRTDLFVGQKQIQQEGFLDIRFEGLQPIIPSSISGGQRLSNLFSYLTLQALYHPNPNFDDMKVSYRAVATDLLSGKRVIIDHGSLAEAMRASITVPLLYSPLEKDSMSLVDGGLISNIPVDVAKSLGCDIVIVVNSASPLRNANQMTKPWEVADQIMTIMMQDPNARQLKMADVVITPEAGDRLVSDFSGVDSLVHAGEQAIEKDIQRILDLLHDRSQTAPSLSNNALQQLDINFTGDEILPEVKQKILDESKQPTISLQDIEKNLNLIFATGRYRDVYAEVLQNSTLANVVYHAALNVKLQSIHFFGNRLISEKVIAQRLSSLKGTTLDYAEIQDALEDIIRLYREKGYSLARIESLKIEQARGELSFTINEGTIKQIRYEGNNRTKDYIIRREFPMDEGDIFDINKAYQGIVNIKSTGLFEYVLLDVEYHENRPVVVLKVNEKSPALLRLGIHADDEHSLVSTVVLRDANFRGANEDISLTMMYGFRDRLARVDYTINRIFHSYFTFNIKGYFKSRDLLSYVDDPTLSSKRWDRIEEGKYKENKYGGTLAFGSHFERIGDIMAELRLENHNIISISGQGYSPERYRFVSLKFQTIVDSEDKFLFPTDGMYLSLSYESAMKNFGSEVGFGKIGVTYESYFTLHPRHTIRPKITFGFADATLPVAEQYSLGGFNSFYGLREDDSRGRQLFLVNMEYRVWLPFKIIFETYMKARYDFGMISSVQQELKLNHFRHGLGVEVALDTPLGQASFGIGKSFYLLHDLPDSPVSVGPLALYFTIGHEL
jgi:NTE family protein